MCTAVLSNIIFIAAVAGSEMDARNLFASRTSGKSGVVSKHMTDVRAETAQNSGIDWFYNWDPTYTGQLVQFSLQFIPQQWTTDTKGVVAPSGSTQSTLLMYNEPDQSGQSGLCYENGQMSAAGAKKMAHLYCNQIKEFNALGYTEFGTPAWSMEPKGDYLDKCVYPFFEEVAKDSQCRDLTKILVWHMYTPCDSQSSIETFCGNRTDEWATVFDKVVADYNFDLSGMYITEFAGWYQGCVTDSDPTGAIGQALVAQYCTPILKNHDKVSRFAWFNDFSDYAGQGTSDLFTASGMLSPIGEAYMKGVSGVASPGQAATTTKAATTTGGATTTDPVVTEAATTTGAAATTGVATTSYPVVTEGATTTESATTSYTYDQAIHV